MRKVYEPSEFIKDKSREEHWFNFDYQDKLALHKALDLYIATEGAKPEDFDAMIDEVRQLLRTYHGAVIHSHTRRPR